MPWKVPIHIASGVEVPQAGMRGGRRREARETAGVLMQGFEAEG
jgi:hypothetical protein